MRFGHYAWNDLAMNAERLLTTTCWALFLTTNALSAEPAPASKLVWVTDQFKAYQIGSPADAGVACQGHLLVPRGGGGPMAAVICRPGQGGSAAEVSGVGMAKDTPHHEFGRRLAERGFVVFASSTPAHGQTDEAALRAIIDFLKRQGFVDGGRIGYYGFGRDPDAAQQIEPLLGDLAVAIVAAGFSDPGFIVMIPGGDGREDRRQDVRGLAAFDVLDRCLRPAAPVGRDYVYTPGAKGRRYVGMPFDGGNPFDTHVLDQRAETRLRGRFWIPYGAGQFRGMALKVSRDGYPGPLHVSFGSQRGGGDFGLATLTAEDVIPLFDTWHSAVVEPKLVKGGETIFYEISAGEGRSAQDNYVVYGPRQPDGNPVGGDAFPLAYRVLTDRPEDRVNPPNQEYAYQFAQQMMGPYYRDELAKRLNDSAAQDNETVLDASWKIHFDANQDREAVLATAADDLRQFLATRAGIPANISDKPAGEKGRAVELVVSSEQPIVGGVRTEEGYRVAVSPQRIVVAARTPRGVMRGVYWLEDMLQFRGGPLLERGVAERECRFRRRITCTVCPSDVKYTETSYPLPYTDGLLRRVSHQGFNAVWLVVSQGEIVVDSKVFPELNHPQAARRLERLRDLVQRGKRFGIDVILYFGNEFCSVPESFYQQHPDTRGVGRCYVGGQTLCSSHPDVKRFVAETTRELFRRVPGLGGLCEIYDSEVYVHCGTGNYKACPRCKNSTPEDIAVDALSVIDRAMREVAPHADHIAWTYLGHQRAWAARAIAKFPKEIILQANFARNVPVVRGGVTNHAEDYIICELGPSDYFTAVIRKAQEAGLRVAAKTEHATALEYVTVPYYPCLQQWCERAERLTEFPLDTLWATYCHYGYTPGRTADVLKWYSWTNGPKGDDLLRRLARRDFGAGAEEDVVRAWEHFTRGFRHFPYSNGVNKYPGPLQTGPSQPLFLDPKEKAMGGARAWQNDLHWCKPWGPKITADSFALMAGEFDSGLQCLGRARQAASAQGQAELDREIGVAETMKRSALSMINMIRWVPLRDAYTTAEAGPEKEHIRRQLIAVGQEELANARVAFAFAAADSRLGAASNGNGSPGRGGLFTPALISKKIGLLEDTLERQLAAGNLP